MNTAEAAPNTGALDALANYWITRIDYSTRFHLEQTPETPEEYRYDSRAQPEANLHTCGASEALFHYLKARDCTNEKANARAAGFDVGFAFALALTQDPLNAEVQLLEIMETHFADDRSSAK